MTAKTDKPVIKEAGAAIVISASNVKSPPTIAADGRGERIVEAGQSISYSSAKSNTAGLSVETAPDRQLPAGRKGRGIAVSRGGGSY
jgi:hypothetical protein